MQAQAKLYVITRADLPPGHQATQSAHAAFAFSQAQPDLTGQWHRKSKFLILLAVPDALALEVVAQRIEMAGITCVRWREPDWDNELTALAVAPHPATSRLLANLPLALREPAMA
jgi:hypothetical protein